MAVGLLSLRRDALDEGALVSAGEGLDRIIGAGEAPGSGRLAAQGGRETARESHCPGEVQG
eukprot:5266696-Lingulodinium_polyedra.AAC.1